MSEIPNPSDRRIPLAWVLCIVPVALALGWAIGRMPGKAPDARAVATRSAPAAASPAPPASAVAARAAGQAAESGSSAGRSEGSSQAASSMATEKPPEETERGPISQWTTFEGAMAESQRNGKPVLIDFSAEWCEPCKRMKQEVFDDWQHSRAIQEAVIPVSIVDRAREDGQNPADIQSLQEKFQVTAFPTLIIFSPATGRGLRLQGFGDAEQTASWIQEAAKAVR